MHLEIITPEAQIFSGEVSAVQFPGIGGSFQVLKDHAPIISALQEGIVKVDLINALDTEENHHSSISFESSNAKTIRIQIKGGVMELLNNKISLLAE